MVVAQGPGWGWMRIYSPWRDDSPLGYGDDVFDTQQAAADDLRSSLPTDALPGELDGLHAQMPKLLRGKGGDGPLVLYYTNEGLMWAWPIYRVAVGEDSRRVGSAFFEAWRSTVLADQRRFHTLAGARGASIFPQRQR